MHLKKLLTATVVVLAVSVATVAFWGPATRHDERKAETGEEPSGGHQVVEQNLAGTAANSVPEKKKVHSAEEAMRVTEAGKLDSKVTLTVEFEVRQVKRSVKVKSDVRDDAPWLVGHGPGDIALGPQPPADWRMEQFWAILTAKAVEQLNKDGVHDFGRYFSGKTIRVAGRVEKRHYVSSDPLAQPKYDLIVDDLSQLEMAK